MLGKPGRPSPPPHLRLLELSAVQRQHALGLTHQLLGLRGGRGAQRPGQGGKHTQAQVQVPGRAMGACSGLK